MEIDIISPDSKSASRVVEVEANVAAKDVPYYVIFSRDKERSSVEYIFNSHEAHSIRRLATDSFSIEYDKNDKNIHSVEINSNNVSVVEMKREFYKRKILMNSNLNFDFAILKKILL